MAHGKSAELAEMPKREMKLLCICGKYYRDHFNEEDELLPEFKDGNHQPQGQAGGLNRATRRRMGIGVKRPRDRAAW